MCALLPCRLPRRRAPMRHQAAWTVTPWYAVQGLHVVPRLARHLHLRLCLYRHRHRHRPYHCRLRQRGREGA